MCYRALLVFVLVSALGCRETPPKPVRTVTARDLHTAYTLDDDARYDGQPVRVLLPAGSYEVGPGAVEWRFGRPTDGPDIRFAIANPPAHNVDTIVIQGKVTKRIWDDARRASGIPWCVHVECCTFTRRP